MALILKDVYVLLSLLNRVVETNRIYDFITYIGVFFNIRESDKHRAHNIMS